MGYYKATMAADEEEHEFNFEAPDLGRVALYIIMDMRTKGDFYGYKSKDLYSLSIEEYIAFPESTHIIKIED